ncbi:hypothetical protein [Micromonospora mirobrigensis]|uniref:Uncharacterized protein n=1 Tax=Micromonospora mirobrigensis TaxID=262898 RepID=A0A1C4WQ52_9ACTN|nr:hypothetical protein [Micromonospora mirobrigensis]SCE98365.1 hypothetical protein GA0070564_102435 [Micromonospora mirobrigensis]
MAEQLEDLLEQMTAAESQMPEETDDEGGQVAWKISYSTYRA